MKHGLLGLVAWLSFSLSAAAAPSLDALVAEVRAAMEAKDAAKLEALTHTAGMNDVELARLRASLAASVGGDPVEKVDAAPLDPDDPEEFIYEGRRYSLTAKPAGMVRVWRKVVGGGTFTEGTYHGVVNGEHRLLGYKSQDLGWKGPEDRLIGFTISSYQQADLRSIRARYNASGVDFERTTKAASLVSRAQRLDEVSFESASDAFEGEVVVSVDGKEVTRSEKFRGKGPFVYRPDLPKPSAP